jgi:cytochrome c oxidase assembly protein subunit 15
MDAKEAFVLWRGLGIDYEGGVLDHPARVAIHFVHRLGALVTALTLLAVGIYAWRSSAARARVAGACVVTALVTQIIVGP